MCNEIEIKEEIKRTRQRSLILSSPKRRVVGFNVDKKTKQKLNFEEKKYPPLEQDPATFWIEDPSLTGYRQRHISQIILSTLCLHTKNASATKVL